MPAPWVAGAQCRIIGEMHGSTTVNVLTFATNEQIVDEGALDTILLALAEAVRDCVIDTLLPAVTSDWRFVQTDARRIFPEPSDPIVVTGTPANVGQLGPSSTSFISSLVHVRTGGGGRRGRGRIFLPPPGEPQIAASLIDEPTLVLIAAFLACVAAKFMGANPTTPWRFGVYSRTIDAQVGQTFDNAFRPATSLNPVATCALLGSRKKGRGA